jgi:putative heme-binding domain-containing protein
VATQRRCGYSRGSGASERHLGAASLPRVSFAFGLRCAAVAALRLAAASALVAVMAPLDAQQHVGQYARADVEHGARLYASHCVACHGERGDAMPGANLRSGQFRNAPTDRELSSLIRDGVPGTAMTASGYTDAERTALVAYLRNMNSVTLEGPRGDPERGRALFDGKGDCGSCHRVHGEGPRFAPDLSGIGATRTASAIEKALLEPSESLLPIHRPVRAVTRDGAVIEGRRLNEDTFTVQLVDSGERLVSLDKRELSEYSVSETGTMPSYRDELSDDERADLLAYLLTLKGAL